MMTKHTLDLGDQYATANEVIKEIQDLFGGPLMGGYAGYRTTGDEKLPEEGGLVTLVFEEVVYSGGVGRRGRIRETTPLVTVSFDIPKKAVFWYSKIKSELSPKNAPMNKFEIEGKNYPITDEIIREVRKSLSGC
jgi:hypothetical protein